MIRLSALLGLIMGLTLLGDGTTPEGQVSQIDAYLSRWHDTGRLNGVVLVARGDEALGTVGGQEQGFQHLAGLDAYVEQLMVDWHVPGVAVGVILTGDGGGEFLRAFGYRDVERGLPVTNKTLFGIGSCAKAFTATAVAALVSDGALGWRTTLRDRLPAFRLYDDYSTDHATPMDLLLHRTGLSGYDNLKHVAAFDMEGLWDKIRQLQPASGFRDRFRYSNLSYQMAGRVVEEISGESYAAFVQRRILEPVGMESTTLSHARARESGDYAIPYLSFGPTSEFGGAFPSASFRNLDPGYEGLIAPSGGIYSSVEDMVEWVRLHLNRGQVEDRSVISEAAMRLMHTPQMGIRYDPEDPHEAFRSYGMGWYVQDYRSHYMVQHEGQVDGYMAAVSFLPFEGIGVVVLTNSYYHFVPPLVSKYVYDHLLGLDSEDRSRSILGGFRPAARAMHERLWGQWDTRPANAPATHPLAEYSGEFRHSLYGTIQVGEAGGELQVTFKDRFPVRLRHFSYDTFLTESDLLHYHNLFFRFRMGSDGDVDGVGIPLDALEEEVLFSVVGVRGRGLQRSPASSSTQTRAPMRGMR
ncbi:MAG: serine hydrolase [Gemmatimonadetes bacterium]|nr:serine hydrolase [Gemmatimonadota bacterium]